MPNPARVENNALNPGLIELIVALHLHAHGRCPGRGFFPLFIRKQQAMKDLNQMEVEKISGGIVDDIIGGHGYAGGPSGGSAPSESWLDRWLDQFGTPFRDL